MLDSEEIKKYYSEWWENPKDIRNIIFESLNNYVEQRIPSGIGRRALDLASGHGRIVSHLVKKGYEVTAVEFNEDFVAELRSRFPSIKVIAEDALQVNFEEKYDIITCIGFAQLLNNDQLCDFLPRLAEAGNLLLIDISNRHSLHSNWVRFRGWQNSFIFPYTPAQFEQIIEASNFEITHRKGIGLVTPISLLKDFRVKLIPAWLAKLFNKLDILAPKICHLYYIEALSNKRKE